jgi:pimeloyl-ACP methyl ester carboxylesterase/DNA-binding winged helix-turn-helix (wHTH) protein
VNFRFGAHEIDTERLELLRDGTPINLEPQVFSLLVLLIENRDRVVSKDEMIEAVWDGRIVSDATLNARINGARRAVGDTGKDQALIRTYPRCGFRFVADIESHGPQAQRAGSDFSQEVRFCQAPDGVSIAYALSGDGPPLMKTANWLNHLEYDWESPVWRPQLTALSSKFKLLRYDQRGTGLSERDVEELSLEAFVDDLEAVADAAGFDIFPLLGMSQGCPVAIAFAVRHPERVSRLVLYGGFSRGARIRGDGVDLAKEEAIATLMREGWGQDNPAFRQISTSQMLPDGTPEQIQWFNDLQRETTTPENAVRLRIAIDEMDVSDILAKVSVPTLVIHRESDARQPFAEGRQLAAAIPDARFVALEGSGHVVLEGEKEWPRYMAEIIDFAGG